MNDLKCYTIWSIVKYSKLLFKYLLPQSCLQHRFKFDKPSGSPLNENKILIRVSAAPPNFSTINYQLFDIVKQFE